jgi:hypothetical protein
LLELEGDEDRVVAVARLAEQDVTPEDSDGG